ncbi:MAG: DUF2878 domain-containing protein [Gammaproteobacteria bacterium]|nr:DUF2878 domain-containing protein [Gammaproteobacteria bacterium]MDP2141046.1 DUF2878 domain-containing protein [Gammaproteobacteria bacterium]MDP2348504.1 DUF2878 domain-containing protein [Gammaproteobacteria bacterium]
MIFNDRQYAVVNGLAFQLSWPMCVLGGNRVAVITTIVFLIFHLATVREKRTELIFLSSAGTMGFMFDLALLKIGLLQSATAVQPLWMICLWFLFATTIGYAMHWFQKHLLVSALFAGIFAPLSYSVGAGLTDIDMMVPTWLSLVGIGAAWAIVLPCLLLLRESIVERLAINRTLEILS